MNITIEMMNVLNQSLEELRKRVSSIRYGKPGVILFDLDKISYQVPEPIDVMPVMYPTSEASLRWALRQYLTGQAIPL